MHCRWKRACARLRSATPEVLAELVDPMVFALDAYDTSRNCRGLFPVWRVFFRRQRLTLAEFSIVDHWGARHMTCYVVTVPPGWASMGF
jgi:hypothetical protein